MHRKVIAFAAVLMLLIPLISLTAFAASSDGNATGWDILDGIANFFRDLRAQIKTSVSTIGDFFSNVINAISRAVNSLLNGIKSLFIPRDDFFDRMLERLHNAFIKKFGNINYLVDYLRNSFSKLSAHKNADKLLSFKIPKGKNQLLGGITLNLYTYLPYFASVIRPALSGFITILTALFCYRKVNKLINT